MIYLNKYDPKLDYYTPVIVTNEKMIKEKPDTVKAFMAATAKGYQYAIQKPEEAAGILLKANPDLDKKISSSPARSGSARNIRTTLPAGASRRSLCGKITRPGCRTINCWKRSLTRTQHLRISSFRNPNKRDKEWLSNGQRAAQHSNYTENRKQ